MDRKIRLDLDALGVDSFETEAPHAGRGTVRAHESTTCVTTPPEYPCTCDASCLCKTAAFYCATAPETAISCDYSHNASCAYVTQTTCTA